MSVPLPLASPLPAGGPKVSSAKPIPQTGLAVPEKNSLTSASPSYRQTGFAPSSASARASAGFASSPADSENWRERGSGARRTSVVAGVSGSVSKGPERTVGGFEKKETAPAQSAGKDQNGAKKDSKAVGPSGSGESKGQSRALRDAQTAVDRISFALTRAVPLLQAGRMHSRRELPVFTRGGRQEGDMPVVPQGKLQIRAQM